MRSEYSIYYWKRFCSSIFAQRAVGILRVMVAAMFAFIVFLYAKDIPVSHSDDDIDVIGRTYTCGVPIPWMRFSEGDSIMGAVDSARFWLLPFNLAFWVVISCILFRVKTLRGFLACMALAQLPLAFFLSLFMGRVGLVM